MAVALEGFRDFQLFSSSKDQYTFDMPTSRPEDFSNYFLGDDLHTTNDMVSSTYDSYPGYSAFVDENPHVSVDGPKDSLRHQQKPRHHTPSDSPAASMSHSIDQSTYSHPSGTSGQSAASSSANSPYSLPTVGFGQQEQQWMEMPQGLGIATTESYQPGFDFTSADNDVMYTTSKFQQDFVDPNLISTYDTQSGLHQTAPSYPMPQSHFAPSPYIQPPSPNPSHTSSHGSRPGPSRNHSPASFNPRHFSPYPMAGQGRRPSVGSMYSMPSYGSPNPNFEDSKDAKRCPHHDCGRYFKDLKAHMLTHQSERPEKCPIVTCEYHVKGFARKYDRCRHTLTHYKGTMVCDFCPGGGSAAEKSFNRADVFKRHLTSVHNVEQAPPNSRKKSPATHKKHSNVKETAGKCSTCSTIFNTAQDLYDHLDECVLKSLEQEEPSEAHNARHLNNVSHDREVKETMEKHQLPTETINADDDEADEDDDVSDEAGNSRSDSRGVPSQTANRIGKNGSRKGKTGLTSSNGGVRLVGTKTSRKKRKHYPESWGCAPDQMKMRKRVLCVFDGDRRLIKDEMMLDSEFEIRMRLNNNHPNGTTQRGEGSYITDLDVRTLERAEGYHNASEEERGPWNPDDEIEKLMVA